MELGRPSLDKLTQRLSPGGLNQYFTIEMSFRYISPGRFVLAFCISTTITILIIKKCLRQHFSLPFLELKLKSLNLAFHSLPSHY